MNQHALTKAIVLATATVVVTLLTGAACGQDYTLRSGDQLRLVLEEDPQWGQTNRDSTDVYTVRPDGKVSIPYVGEIQAQGMTVGAFTQEVEKDLSKYYVDPHVTANVTQLGTTRVYVFGEVHKPGVYELTKGHRVMDAIGAAGSFTWDTGKKQIFLIRQDGSNTMTPIHLNQMLQTGDLRENYELQEGDILYLTRNHRISFSRDIAPFFGTIYNVSRIGKN